MKVSNTNTTELIICFLWTSSSKDTPSMEGAQSIGTNNPGALLDVSTVFSSQPPNRADFISCKSSQEYRSSLPALLLPQSGPPPSLLPQHLPHLITEYGRDYFITEKSNGRPYLVCSYSLFSLAAISPLESAFYQGSLLLSWVEHPLGKSWESNYHFFILLAIVAEIQGSEGSEGRHFSSPAKGSKEEDMLQMHKA